MKCMFCLIRSGYNIGKKLVEDYYASLNNGMYDACKDFDDYMKCIAERAMLKYLDVKVGTKFSDRDIQKELEEEQKKPKDKRIAKLEKRSCSLSFEKSPLEKYSIIPKNMSILKYSNIISGAIRGALESVGLV